MGQERYKAGTPVWCNGYQGVVVTTRSTPGGRVEVRLSSGTISVDPADDREILPRVTPDVPRRRLEDLVWRHTHRDGRSRRDGGTRCVLVLREPDGTPAPSPLGALTDAELMKKLPSNILTALVKERRGGGSSR